MLALFAFSIFTVCYPTDRLTKYKTEKVEDVVSEGDEVWVKVIAIAEDEDGTRKLSLSMKHVNQSSGLDMVRSFDITSRGIH